ncbi:cell envelope integrity EipB family protein [Methyloligella solikamskensis]|uniref:Cell envelope integrity EipB family protein n=1 Tax=Methyloligella solikamskensis TaxID=1177756 RepID=A0ABW3JCJ0_9HYPH
MFRSVPIAFRLLPLLLVFGGVATSAAAAGAKLQPHRAIYEMRLEDARSASGITGVDGRMVYEFSGSECEGYTLNMRMVTQMTDSQGETNLTDLRSSTWEDGQGKKFRFQSAQYMNDKLGDVTMGRALRESPNEVEVRLTQPKHTELNLSPKVLFPTQHSLAVIEAAKAGKTKLEAELYDGSELGQKVYDTTSFIGNVRPPGSDDDLEPAGKERGLDKLRSWPISIGYFETKGGDLTPAYQIDFLLYENGVSRKLEIDYGDFAISGDLSQLEYLQEDACD